MGSYAEHSRSAPLKKVAQVMDILTLILALLVSWGTGFAVLRLGANRVEFAAHPASLLGFGYFVGMALTALYLRLTYALLGSYSMLWSVTIVSLIATAAIGTLLLQRHNRTLPRPTAAARLTPQRMTLAAWFFLALCLVHMACVVVEILYRPVFPWDAWLNWMYRAKAWYLSGAIGEFDAVSTWARGVTTNSYALDGHNYPTLVPLIALWSALSLGAWSETLVNLPTLLCGFAILCALYGMAAERGFSHTERWFLLFTFTSIPLVTTHLSLAGQADIWIVAYSGLGLIALANGMASRNGWYVFLGLFLLVLATQVKLEGWLWLVVAAGCLCFFQFPVRAALVAGGLVAAASVAFWLSGGAVELPLIGTVGVLNGALLIPLFGEVSLVSFDLVADYRQNFFLGGTWNVLWLAFGFAAVTGIALKDREIRIGTGLLGLLLIAQLLLFNFTEHGNWAKDWTAINRLPLQLTPALVWVIALAIRRIFREKWVPLKTSASLAVLSLVTSLLGLAVLLNSDYPTQTAESVPLAGSALSFRSGGGYAKNESLHVSRYQDGIAIASRAGLALDAESLGFLRLSSDGGNSKPLTFFWRNGIRPESLQSIEIPGVGLHEIVLSAQPAWSGRVTEVGVVVYADASGTASINTLEILPINPKGLLRKTWDDWFSKAHWTQRSVHWLPAGDQYGLYSLQKLALSMLPVALLLSVFSRKRSFKTLSQNIAVALIAAWVMLDTRWLYQQLTLAADTYESYPLLTAQHLEFSDDALNLAAADTAKQLIGDSRHRILLSSDTPEAMRFEMLRTKYHLLPYPAHVLERTGQRIPPLLANDYLVLKPKLYGLEASAAKKTSAWLEEFAKADGKSLSLLFENDRMLLVSASKP